MTESSTAADVRHVLETWADKTRRGLLDEVLANHSPNVLIYDVLPPMKYESAKAYRASWGDWQPETPSDGQFEFADLDVVANEGLAFANGFIRCGGTLPNGHTFEDIVRATFCLTKEADRWKIVHQHISKPWSR